MGERRSADLEGAAAAAPVLADLLKDFDDSHRFNLDETCCYWRLLPLRTHADADDQAEGFKRVKDRITIVVITNAAGYFDVSTTFFAFHFKSNRINYLVLCYWKG